MPLPLQPLAVLVDQPRAWVSPPASGLVLPEQVLPLLQELALVGWEDQPPALVWLPAPGRGVPEPVLGVAASVADHCLV